MTKDDEPTDPEYTHPNTEKWANMAYAALLRQDWRTAQTLLEKCLAARGYVHFRMTREQAARLKHLRAGSEERRDYLYRLSSDASVIASQRL